MIPAAYQPRALALYALYRQAERVYRELWPQDPPTDLPAFTAHLAYLVEQSCADAKTLDLGQPPELYPEPTGMAECVSDVVRARQLVLESLARETDNSDGSNGITVAKLGDTVARLARSHVDLLDARLNHTLRLYELRRLVLTPESQEEIPQPNSAAVAIGSPK